MVVTADFVVGGAELADRVTTGGVFALVAVPDADSVGIWLPVRVDFVVAADLLELVVLAHVGLAGLAPADSIEHGHPAFALAVAVATEALEVGRALFVLVVEVRRRSAAAEVEAGTRVEGVAVVVRVVAVAVPGAELEGWVGNE